MAAFQWDKTITNVHVYQCKIIDLLNKMNGDFALDSNKNAIYCEPHTKHTV